MDNRYLSAIQMTFSSLQPLKCTRSVVPNADNWGMTQIIIFFQNIYNILPLNKI